MIPAQPALVLFSGRWCGACAAMQPVWQAFAKDYRGPLRLIYVDVDELDSPQYKAYAPLWEKTREMPQVCLVDGKGRLQTRLPGLLTRQQLNRLAPNARKAGL